VAIAAFVLAAVALVAVPGLNRSGDGGGATDDETAESGDDGEGGVLEPRPEDIPEPADEHVDDPREPETLPAASSAPSGGDATTQPLVDGCAADAVDDCDRLWAAGTGGDVYDYGATCGGRLDTGAAGACVATFAAVPTTDDADQQALVDGCAGDRVDDCDRLWAVASSGPLGVFARTCGNRYESADASGDCTVRFAAVPTTDDPELEALVDGCRDGAVDDCDRLWATASSGPLYTYARTCGHRYDTAEASGDCTLRFAAVPSDDDPERQDWISSCHEGRVENCDRLYAELSTGPVRDFARSCGHRLETAEAAGDCILRYEQAPTAADTEIQADIDACEDGPAGCDALYGRVSSGPIYTYARTCGFRLDAPDAGGDCATRLGTSS
jgi:hypothetical protein